MDISSNLHNRVTDFGFGQVMNTKAKKVDTEMPFFHDASRATLDAVRRDVPITIAAMDKLLNVKGKRPLDDQDWGKGYTLAKTKEGYVIQPTFDHERGRYTGAYLAAGPKGAPNVVKYNGEPLQDGTQALYSFNALMKQMRDAANKPNPR